MGIHIIHGLFRRLNKSPEVPDRLLFVFRPFSQKICKVRGPLPILNDHSEQIGDAPGRVIFNIKIDLPINLRESIAGADPRLPL